MSGERLREAATLLRERAEGATAATGAWSVSYIPEQAVPEAHIIDRWFIMDRFESGQETGPYATCEYEPAAAYIATMSPLAGLALADLLDEHAHRHEPECTTDDDCNEYRLADVILGANA